MRGNPEHIFFEVSLETGIGIGFHSVKQEMLIIIIVVTVAGCGMRPVRQVYDSIHGI